MVLRLSALAEVDQDHASIVPVALIHGGIFLAGAASVVTLLPERRDGGGLPSWPLLLAALPLPTVVPPIQALSPPAAPADEANPTTTIS